MFIVLTGNHGFIATVAPQSIRSVAPPAPAAVARLTDRRRAPTWVDMATQRRWRWMTEPGHATRSGPRLPLPRAVQ